MASAEERFEALYRAHERDIYAYCRRRIDLNDAADCAADTFLVAWRRLDDVPDGEEALFWLYATARHVLANHRRARGRLMRLIRKAKGRSVNSPDPPETVAVRHAEDRHVLEALDRIRPADGELLRLALWEEVPRDRLAEMNGCSVDTINQRIHRAGKRLARYLPDPEWGTVRHRAQEESTR